MLYIRIKFVPISKIFIHIVYCCFVKKFQLQVTFVKVKAKLELETVRKNIQQLTQA